MSPTDKIVACYSRPDTSDKRPDESWVQCWDRRAYELHGSNCMCVTHRLKKMEIGNEPPC